MPKFFKSHLLFMFFVVIISSGCSSNQTMKDAWKSTKGSWYTYASPQAAIDYEEIGNMSPAQVLLSSEMVGIDIQLIKLERIMLNGDKSPTGEWISKLFETVPWITGFAGVRDNGEILGQEPAGFSDSFDFSPLLEPDEKQSMRALRATIIADATPPEILLATPLYESSEFLGVVVTSFNIPSLLKYSKTPSNLIIFTPKTLLWSGDFAQVSDAILSLDWEATIKDNVTGNVSIADKKFHWIVRYIGNLPVIFAVLAP